MSSADTRSKISLFEKAAAANRVECPERQRQRAKFNARKSKFEQQPETSSSSNNNSNSNGTGEVMRKASLFGQGGDGVGALSEAAAAELERKQQEEIERKQSFDNARRGFLQREGAPGGERRGDAAAAEGIGKGGADDAGAQSN